MEKIELGPEARKLLMVLFMESYIHCPEPLAAEEIEALCLLTGLQVLGAQTQTPAFQKEVQATMAIASRRTGAPVRQATIEGLPEVD